MPIWMIAMARGILFLTCPSVLQPIQNAESQECIDGISSTLNGQFNGLKSNVKVTVNSWDMFLAMTQEFIC